jgi:hypothetical protein
MPSESLFMRLFRMLTCFTLAATLTGAASAEVPSADVRAYMDRSGMTQSLLGGAEGFGKGFQERAKGIIPPEFLGPATDIVVAAMDDQRLIAAVEAACAEALTPEDLREANAFIDSPFGSRITAAEIEGSKPEVSTEIMNRQSELVAALKADEARLAVVEGIDASLRATDVNTAIIMSLTRAVMQGGASDTDVETSAMAEQMLEAMRPQMRDETRSYMLASFAHIYRGFSTEELRTYADYLGTPSTRTLYGTVFAAVSERYIAAGEEIGKGLAALKKQKRS